MLIQHRSGGPHHWGSGHGQSMLLRLMALCGVYPTHMNRLPLADKKENQMFDLKAFAGAKHSGTIEKGEYPAVIDKMEWVESSAGEMMLVATVSILLAHGGKKVVKDYFNLFNKNTQAAEISATRLADLVGACGLSETPSDARVFEGMKCWVKVGVDKNGYNDIDRFMYWKPTDNKAVLMANLSKLSEGDYPKSEEQIQDRTIITPEEFARMYPCDEGVDEPF